MWGDDEQPPCSDERADISLRPADPSDSSELLREIVEQLKTELPASVSSGGKWLKGKADQEWARAYQIKAQVLEAIGRMDVERERLLQERKVADQRVLTDGRNSALEEEKVRLAHTERMYELRTQRMQAMKDVVECVLKLREAGLEVDLQVVAGRLLAGD